MPDAPETPQTEVAAKRVGQLARTENVVKIVGIIATFVLVVVLLIQNVTLLAHQDDLVQSSRRADCRAAIAAEFSDIKDHRFSVLLGTVFNHKPPGTPLTEAESKKIRRQNAKVDALPSLPHAVKHGATINGKHFAPCPKVG